MEKTYSGMNLSANDINNYTKYIVSHGAKVTGTNPMVVDTGLHGIVLSLCFNDKTKSLLVKVIKKNFYVPDSAVFNEVDKGIEKIKQQLSAGCKL